MLHQGPTGWMNSRRYAVPIRYEDLLDVEPLDREATLALVAEVGGWAAGFVEGE
jgi:hypothetical protein